MDPLAFLRQELEKAADLSAADSAVIDKVIGAHSERMRAAHPNYDLYTLGTGQRYGLKIQEKIIDSFTDLSKNTRGSDYDATNSLGEKIEIKSIKVTKGSSSHYIGSRIVNLTEKSKAVIGGSFQQVKPKACDWFIFHVLYGDAERIFLVPAKMFSATPKKANRESGRLLLSAQHRDHQTEGQANAGQIVSRAKYFEPSIIYSSRTVDSFSFAKLKKEIILRLNKLGKDWKLPEV